MSALPLVAAPASARLIVAGGKPGVAAMAALERDWKRLHQLARPLNPFLSWEWQSSWAAVPTHRVRPLVVAEPLPSGGLAGLLALQRARRYGLTQLEFLGQGAGGDELDCLLHPDAPEGVAQRLWAAALQRCRWDLLRLESLAEGGTAACAEALPNASVALAGEWLPYLRLPARFDDFLAAQSANFRAEVRRRRRALFRRLPQARLECAQSPAAVAEALEALCRLHQLRRRQQGGRGIFTPATRRFHRHATAGFAASATMHTRVYLLRDGRAAIAALYGFQARERFFYFQSGFDPAYREHSPGTVLLSAVIEDCIARGLAQFEFLRGEEGYKGRWTASSRPSAGLLAAGSAAGRAWLRLRQWRRQLQGRDR
jgi:CelD/BcsL family acetyltransferase involved in cellulose biosynthesis